MAIKHVKHVVAVSGGKDSTALALRLKEVNPGVDYVYLITPTGNEPPEMFEHWRRLEEMLGKPFIRLQPFKGDGLEEVIKDQNAVPNFRMRFCTRMLKIEPTIEWLEANSPCTQYVGLRADEEHRGGIYGDMEGVKQCYPFREWGWGIDEVLGYLEERGVTVPVRTDCDLCYHQRLSEWWWLWKDRPEAFQNGVRIEQEMGNTFRSPGRDTWPVALVELEAEFAKGRKPRGVQDRQQMQLFNCDKDALCRVCTL